MKNCMECYNFTDILNQNILVFPNYPNWLAGHKINSISGPTHVLDDFFFACSKFWVC